MSRESYGAGGQYGGGSTSSSSSNAGGGGDGNREQYAAQTQYQAPSPAPSGGGDSAREQYLTTQYPTLTPSEIEKGITDKGQIIDEKVQQESLLGNILDLYQQYSPVGKILDLGGSILSNIGDASTSLQNKAIAFDLQNRLQKAYQDPTFDPFTPDASVTQLEQDLAKAQSGDFTQSEYESRYGKAGDTGQLTGGGGDGERALRTALTPYAPYAITGTTPQDSMVNQYFANLGMSNQPLSSNLQTDYNNAKTNINSLLGILPPSQQFGYSTAPYGLLSSTNLASNPFNIDYLQQRGLI